MKALHLIDFKKINLYETDEVKLLNGEGVVVVKQPFKFLETKLKDENEEEIIYRLQTVPAEYNDKDAVKDDTVKKDLFWIYLFLMLNLQLMECLIEKRC